MGLLIYGQSSTIINVSEFFVFCPCCESHQWADGMVKSNYYHFYFIPILPIGKEVNLICQNCGIKRYGAGFDSKTFSNFNEIKNNFPHPVSSYIVGISLLTLIIAGIIYGLI